MVSVVTRQSPGGPLNGIPVAQSSWCNYRVISHWADYIIDVWPEDNYPNGKEGKGIAEAWSLARSAGSRGLLLLGCDVAGDPDDYQAMAAAILSCPDDLYTGMVKLWPESTKRDDWMWSHRGGTLGAPAATQDETVSVAYVSLGYLWVPGRLLDLAAPDMGTWQWGSVDVKLSELALASGIAAHAVPGCRPKHLHYQQEHDGQAILGRSAGHTTATS